MSETYRWFVGIDWATGSHAVCVPDRERGIAARKTIEHGGSGMAQFVMAGALRTDSHLFHRVQLSVLVFLLLPLGNGLRASWENPG